MNKLCKKILAVFLTLNLIFGSNFTYPAVYAVESMIASAVGAGIASIAPNVVYNVFCQIGVLFREINKHTLVSKYSGFRSTEEIIDRLKKIYNGTSDIKVYGQDKAKKQMYDTLSGVAARIDILKRQEASGNPVCSNDVRGNIIYMIGPSGTGKTQMCYAIADAFLKHPEKTCIFCHSESITGDSELGTQLFKTVATADIGEQRTTNWITGNNGLIPKEEESPMLKHLLQWFESVVILDEYDKMKLKSAKPGILMPAEGSMPEGAGAANGIDNSADEILRSIASTGKYKCMNKEINCEKTLFLITTNDKLEDIQQNFGIKGSEGGGIQRLNIVEFDYLDLDACQRIVDSTLVRIAKNLMDSAGPFKVSSVNFSEESKNLMASYVFNDKIMQGRAKNKLEDGIYSLMSRSMGKDYNQNIEIKFKLRESNPSEFDFFKDNI